MPKVTVLMSVFNGGRMLERSVQSVLSQNFADFEFLIVDDCSQDTTGEYLRGVAARDSRVQVIHNKENIGLTRSLNKGLSKAKGEYVARHDSDDISLSGRLAMQVTFLDGHPDVGVLGAAYETVNLQGKSINKQVPPDAHPSIVWKLCTGCNPIAHPLAMFRADVVRNAGGYDENCYAGQDYELWSRLMFATRFANLKDVLLQRVVHDAQISYTHQQTQRENAVRVMQRTARVLLGRELSDEDRMALLGVSNFAREASHANLKRAMPLQIEYYEAVAERLNLSRLERAKMRESVSSAIADNFFLGGASFEIGGLQLVKVFWGKIAASLGLS